VMDLDCRSFFPLPLWERVAPKATGEGSIAVLSESCEDVLQDDRGTLQDIIVPVMRDLEAPRDQDRVPGRVTFGRCMLTAVDLNDQASLEANEIENKALKGNLTTNLNCASRRLRSKRHIGASASVGSRRIAFAKSRMCFVVGRWRGVCATNPSPVASLRSPPPSPTRGEGR